MTISRLTTQNFRNLKSSSLELHPSINFFVGDNGSGKSSLLESIFFLGHGKSFRTSKVDSLVCYEQSKFVVSVKNDNDCQLGLQRDISSGATTIKVDGVNYTRLSELAKNIAIQIVTPESFKLFFGGPKERRKFTDLGMFHVKHNFSSQWKDFARLLKQRNACIKSNVDDNTFNYWTEQFCQQSLIVAEERKVYVDSLIVEINEWIHLLLPDISDKVTVQYLRGWPQKKELIEVLNVNKERELAYGYSLYGAHKFDVKFLLNKQPIETQLSRGQQKLFLLALTFAQAKLIARVERVKPILLIDDIGAELDFNSRSALSSAIECLNCQVIITAIENTVLHPFAAPNSTDKYKMFHVKHGEVLPSKLYPDTSDS
jgi:DNA replication and repair protein RecF